MTNTILDDLILNENDLTEEAKRRFPYHTDILNAYEGYRRIILRNKNLSPMNRHLLFSDLSRFYTTCKQVLNYMAENNELLSRNLPTFGPVVICSLPRTGTTLLYNLLGCDSRCRAPSFIEMLIESAPPIAQSNSVEQERRAAIARSFLKGLSDRTDGTANELESSHPFYDIEEDYFMLVQAGSAAFFLAIISDGPSELGVNLAEDMKKNVIYDYHETFLRMLNSVDAPSSHWLLKAPAHLLYLDTLIQRYPNAALIMTYRSIDEVLPSFYRLMFNLHGVYSIEVNSPSAREILMKQYTEFFDKMLECLVKFRTRHSAKNIFDVSYDDLMEQPIRTVRRIYDHFGLQWSDEFEKAMESWLRDNPQGKRGRHSYSLADYGLTHEDIETRYADYTNLFLRSSKSSDDI
jgi:hypothetical protein